MAKILVVDDDAAVLATIKLILDRVGHDVTTASDGKEGLAIFASAEFDLLLLDIFMPGMDGIETMRLVHRQRPRMPIIAISGKPLNLDGTPDFLKMAVKLGAISSLQKPFKPAQLLEAVKSSLGATQRLHSPNAVPSGHLARSP